MHKNLYVDEVHVRNATRIRLEMQQEKTKQYKKNAKARTFQEQLSSTLKKKSADYELTCSWVRLFHIPLLNTWCEKRKFLRIAMTKVWNHQRPVMQRTTRGVIYLEVSMLKSPLSKEYEYLSLTLRLRVDRISIWAFPWGGVTSLFLLYWLYMYRNANQWHFL